MTLVLIKAQVLKAKATEMGRYKDAEIDPSERYPELGTGCSMQNGSSKNVDPRTKLPPLPPAPRLSHSDKSS